MNIEHSESHAGEFVIGLEGIVPISDQTKDEIFSIFSKIESPVITVASLKEKITRPLLKEKRADIADRLTAVDSYISFFFADSLVKISEAAIKRYAHEIDFIKAHPSTKSESSEIALSVLFESLGSVGVQLKDYISQLRMNGFKEFAKSAEGLFYDIANGKGHLEDFIKSISSLTDLPRATNKEETLETIKKSIHFIASAAVRLKKRMIKIEKKEPSFFTANSAKRLQEIFDNHFVHFKNEFRLTQLDSIVGVIEKWEKSLQRALKAEGFLQGKALSSLRAKILATFSRNNLFTFLEIPISSLSDSLKPFVESWKNLALKVLFETYAEKPPLASAFLAHITALDKTNWKTYPWDYLYTIICRLKSKDTASFDQLYLNRFELFFRKHISDISTNQLKVFIDLFYKKNDQEQSLKLAVDKALSKTSSIHEKLDLLISEDLKVSNKVWEGWNRHILASIDFSNNIKDIADSIALLATKDPPSYFRILFHIHKNYESQSAIYKALLDYSPKLLSLSYEMWQDLEGFFLVWSSIHVGTFDKDLYKLVIPYPHEALKEVASLGIEDRSELPVTEKGLIKGLGSKFQMEALSWLEKNIDAEAPNQRATLKATRLLHSRFELNNDHSHWSSYVGFSRLVGAEHFKKQQQQWVKHICDQISKVGYFPNDFLTLPIGVYRHSMQLTLLKQSQGFGREPKFTLLITNTGNGLDNWHPSAGDPPKYATTAIVGEITQKQLASSMLWEQLTDIMTVSPSEGEDHKEFTDHQVDVLYRTISRACGRSENSKMLLHSEGLYPFKRPQHGASCVISSMRDVTKTLFTLILMEQQKGNKTQKFSAGYLESELLVEEMDKWVAQTFLQKEMQEMDGQMLKIRKKGASIFRKFAQPSEFSATEEFLIKATRSMQPLHIFENLGRSNRIIKDLTKELVSLWIKKNKSLESIQKKEGHPILEVAKLRFQYKIKIINQACEYIKLMEKEELRDKQIIFIENAFKELKTRRIEHLLLPQLEKSIPRMVSGNNNILLLKMLDLSHGTDSRAKIEELIIAHLLKTISNLAKPDSSKADIYLITQYFESSGYLKVIELLSPIFKSLSQRPMVFHEFLLLRNLLVRASPSIQNKILDMVLSKGKLRNPSFSNHEILFPFLLNIFHNRKQLNDLEKNLLQDIKRRLASDERSYLRSVLGEIAA